MLNELLVLERGLAAAGFDVPLLHPDLSYPGRMGALQVRLDRTGTPVEVAALAPDRVAELWRLTNGKQNSFPFVQLKKPLLSVPSDDAWREKHGRAWKGADGSTKRALLRSLTDNYRTTTNAGPISDRFRTSLGQRRAALAELDGAHAAVPAVLDRMLAIAGTGKGFLSALAALLLDGLEAADEALLDLACVALAGQQGASGVVGIPIYLDVARGEFERDVAHPSHASSISRALSANASATREMGTCFLEGVPTALHAGQFPNPKALGSAYLFSKNSEIPAACRYGRADTAGLAVGAELVQRLGGALDAITGPHLKGKAWRSVPGEKPKSSDLLIAFVKGVPGAPAAAVVAPGDGAGDDADDEGEFTGHLDPVEAARRAEADARGIYLTRAERLVRAVEAAVGADFRATPVDLLVLRKVDAGNAKAILHRALTVDGLHAAATAWGKALDNLPGWLSMLVPAKDRRVWRRRPPELAPLELPRATRTLFLRGGTERAKREPVGMTAADALGLFLGEQGHERVARAALRLVLARQGGLFAGAAHALRQDAGTGKLDHAKDFDRAAALRAASLVGLLLARLGREREMYMNDAAFRLGQLLAAADVVHAGFCVDRRDGGVPPSLLGNSLLAMAQTRPLQCLSILGRRWPVYAAWAKNPAVLRKADATRGKLDGKGQAKRSPEGRALASAHWAAIAMSGVARALHDELGEAPAVDDEFRAELLLGYVAGLPPPERRDGGSGNEADGLGEDEGEVTE